MQAWATKSTEQETLRKKINSMENLMKKPNIPSRHAVEPIKKTKQTHYHQILEQSKTASDQKRKIQIMKAVTKIRR